MIKTAHGVVVSARGSFRGIVTENLVLHYNTFNTDSYQDGDGAVITDISGNNLNGTVTGAPTFSGSYFTFVNDYITTANLNTSLTEVHSTELWIYPTSNGVVMQANAQSAPNQNYHHTSIEIVNGSLEYGLWNGVGITSTGATEAISFNDWHQVVLTYNGVTVKGYLDGQFVGSVNVAWDSPEEDTGNFYYNFGYQDSTNQGDGSNFDGRFGIMRVYDVELSASQIAQNYSSPTDNVVLV